MKDFECLRHNYLSILASLKGIEIGIDFNRHLLAGELLHTILQETFLRSFSRVQLYYHRYEFDIEKSLYWTMKFIESKWHNVFLSEHYSQSHMIDEIEAAMEKCEEQIPNLAKLSTSLVHIMDDDTILTSSVAEEFVVRSQVGEYLFLTGHVDLVSLEDNHLKLIELKTGGKYAYDATQLRMYGEIFARRHSKDLIKMELWYSKNGSIRNIEIIDNESVLEGIEKVSRMAPNISTEKQLPPPISKYRCGRFCQLCDMIPEIFRTPEVTNQFAQDDLY